MDKKPFESIDNELFASLPEQELSKVAAGYIVSSSNKAEHTVIHHIVDQEYVD